MIKGNFWYLFWSCINYRYKSYFKTSQTKTYAYFEFIFFCYYHSDRQRYLGTRCEHLSKSQVLGPYCYDDAHLLCSHNRIIASCDAGYFLYTFLTPQYKTNPTGPNINVSNKQGINIRWGKLILRESLNSHIPTNISNAR